MSEKKKKSGLAVLGKAIGGIFVTQVDIEDEEDEGSDEELSEAEIKELASAPVTEESETPKKKEVAINPDIVKSIKDHIKHNSLDSYDYMKFMKSIDDQKDDMPSEKKLYKMAYSFAHSAGITKEILITTADHYITIISEHQKEFDAKLASEEADKVVKLKNDAKSIESTITDAMDRIEELKAQVDKLHKEKMKTLEVAEANEADLIKLRQEGSLAYRMFSGQIKDGKSKINEYVPDERE